MIVEPEIAAEPEEGNPGHGPIFAPRARRGGIIWAMAGLETLSIPDPALVVLVGAAGAGKSTFAARHFAPDEVVSSDALREAIAGDAADQRASGPAFAALHRTVTRRLAAGRLTVVDATNVTPDARRELTRRARRAGVPAVAVVLDLPADLVMARNGARPGRRVPADVVRHQLADLAASLRAGMAGEGWAAILRFDDPAVIDAVRVERGAARPAEAEGDPAGGS